jgi:uncharacterized protein (TIGR02594 family)
VAENKWADIDDAGYWQKPKAEDDSKKTAVTDEDTKPEPKPPLVKLSSGTFIEPSMGFEYNKQCRVRIKVDYLDESAKNMKKVNFSLFSKYLDKTENLNVSVDGYEQDGYAEADVTLYYPSAYDEEKDKNVVYFFRATHCRGDKAVDSMELNMPQPTHFVELKKDDYDENGANKYNKEQDGDNYKEKQVVSELQKNLVTLGFLADGDDVTDGYFGDNTDKAVRDFQDCAIKTDRMKRSKGKIEQADKALDQSEPDGIVGKKTADEIDLWLKKDWVKPQITLRHGEYDDTGVQNGKGKSETDDHHKGTPVVKAQENLQKVEVYKDCNVDGWFYDKMQDSVKKFQEAAEAGKFLIDNVLTDIGEKLTGHVKGSYCPKTQAYMEKVVEKKGVVPKPSKPKWIEIAEKEIGQKEIKGGDKDNPRIIEYHSTTTLKAKHDEVYWCSAFVNWVMTQAGYKGTNSAVAKSWKNWGKNVNKPIYGAIAVFDFGNSGHVGFVVEKKGKKLLILGGNQSDQVMKSLFKTDKIVAYIVPSDYNDEVSLEEANEQFTEANFQTTR